MGRPLLVPICTVTMPILRNLPTETMIKIIEEEVDAAWRFRFVVNKLLNASDAPTLLEKISDVFQEVEYHVRKLDNEYKDLLRKRDRSLAGVMLGSVGFVISVAVPQYLVEYAKEVFGVLSAAKVLDYVYAVQDTHPQLRKSDFYVAWKAWKAGLEKR